MLRLGIYSEIFVFACMFFIVKCEQPNVETIYGTVQGLEQNDRRGNVYHSFRGIPFAKPPIGSLRFMEPQEPDKWDGILTAYNYSSVCPQLNHTQEPEDEDCLYLNVFVPKFNNDTVSKAVIVYVYGGGYGTGGATSKQLGPDNIMAGDVILVTFNYRLGLLGFSAFDDPTLNIFGNHAMKDVILALEWVQKNIATFGGDPKKVTIVGNSSGGSMVHLLLFSKLSKGLFARAIMESGSIFYTTTQVVTARQAAEHALKKKNSNQTIENDWDAFNILNASTANELSRLLSDFAGSEPGSDLLYPVVENPLSPRPFLTRDPLELARSGNYIHVPVMIGYNNEEAVAKYTNETYKFQYKFIQSPSYNEGVFGLKNFTKARENGLAEKLLEEVYAFYFNDRRFSNLYNFLHMEMDIEFVLPVYDALKLQFLNSKSDCYIYRFCMDTEVNYLKHKLNVTWMKGAAHADELGYIFHQDFYPTVTPGSNEDIGIDRMVAIWSNFVKTGNPNSPNNTLQLNWKPATKKNFSYLNIDLKPRVVNAPLPEQNRFSFWERFRRKNAKLEATLDKLESQWRIRKKLKLSHESGERFDFIVPLLIVVVAVMIVVIVVKMTMSERFRRHRFYERIY